MVYIAHAQNEHFNLFDPLTSDELYLMRGRQGLQRKYLELSRSRQLPFDRLGFHFIWLIGPAEPAMTDLKNLTLDLAFDVIWDIQVKVCNIL